MALPCILNKIAVASLVVSNKSILYFKLYATGLLKTFSQDTNDMHHILGVLQFTLGQSVIHLLLAPPVPIWMRYLASNCVSWSLTETVNHFGDSCLSLK